MKRYGHLYPEIIAFENLLQSARNAQKGKRFRDNVLEFNYQLETSLQTLQQALTQKTYQPGSYHTFYVMEPKRRMIFAAPYRDRVVHHALCNIIVPIFERTFIQDSYANRVGFGTHRALRRFTHFARSHRYVLQCDIKKYFPSIDHAILKSTIRRKIKCPDTLWLIDTIINASNPQEPILEHFPGDDLLTPIQRQRGLPIGNLTSQFFANIYLNPFDHFVKEQLGVQSYLRYVDDFALFSDDREFLVHCRHEMEDKLAGLRLRIHPIKSQCFETRHGANFLGFRILPDQIRVRSENLRRARRRLRHQLDSYRREGIDGADIVKSLESWFAHLEHGTTWHLRQRIINTLPSDLQTMLHN
ncbi:MAG: RNA-directed DNA polymerase [Synechococcales cyanobacterium K44_A2020_017]|nr:RNA-directed DNA polymerase [Synechococcales cyanobacterium K32_A2020_035]MBF2095528.1 RNA-directed DNA polymerase [Synechococcales cyanobacterium K44_A2020_017]